MNKKFGDEKLTKDSQIYFIILRLATTLSLQ